MRELHSKNLRPQEVSEVSQADIARKVTELIFSQNSVGICHDYYWRQSEYLETNADTLIVVSDKASDMFYERSKGKGGLLSTGNF